MNLTHLTELRALIILFQAGFLDYAATVLITALLIGIFLGVLVNAIFMLISPRAWAHLPNWMRFAGRLPARQFTSAWGRLEVRLGGAATLGVLALLLQAMIISRIPDSRASHVKGVAPARTWQALSTFFTSDIGHRSGTQWLSLLFLLLLATSLAINGVFMLIWPLRWFSLPPWIRGHRGYAERILRSSKGTVLLRCSGALLLAADALLMYGILSKSG